MKNEQLFGFEELEIWKKSRIFKQRVAELVKGFPPDEKYRLSDQLLRSSRSTNSLIAEGHGRYTTSANKKKIPDTPNYHIYPITYLPNLLTLPTP